MTARILFVDDEVRVLDGIKRSLHGRFDVECAVGAESALETLKEGEPFAVIVSDMRMPGMDGIELLRRVKKLQPDAVRMMLTGNNDQATATSAVNKGEVFRFLNKPCAAGELESALKAGIDLYQITRAEKELLENTLQGSISVMTELLATSQPETYGAVDRIHSLAMRVAERFDDEERWIVESAVRLSRIGFVGLSDELIRKYNGGEALGDEQRGEFEQHAQIGADMVARIPRLEPVADAIRCQCYRFDRGDDVALKGDALPFAARLLHVINSYDRLHVRGDGGAKGIRELRRMGTALDPAIVDELERHVSDESDASHLVRLAIDDLNDGMIIMEDVVNDKGVLLICEGQTITPAIRTHLAKFERMGILGGTVLVRRPDE